MHNLKTNRELNNCIITPRYEAFCRVGVNTASCLSFWAKQAGISFDMGSLCAFKGPTWVGLDLAFNTYEWSFSQRRFGLESGIKRIRRHKSHWLQGRKQPIHHRANWTPFYTLDPSPGPNNRLRAGVIHEPLPTNAISISFIRRSGWPKMTSTVRGL